MRSGGSVEDITLNYQNGGSKIDPRFFGLLDETLKLGLVSV